MRQRQSTTNQEIQKIVETTQRQTSHHRFRSSRKSKRLPRYNKLYRDSADHPTIQNAVKIPQAQFSTGSQFPQLGSNAKHQPSRAHSSRWRSLRLIICEQTSGVLRHTKRVQDDKVQKQDWKQSLEKKFCAPRARPRSGSRRRRQQGPRGSQRSTGRRVVNQKCVPEGRGSVRRDGLF